MELPLLYEAVQRLLGADAGRRRFVTSFVRPRAGERILEVGCGPGGLLALLPDDVHYVGFDANPAYIANAQRRHPRGRFYCARVAAAAEEEAATFDLVVACALLHHLDDGEAGQLVAGAGRWLRPGGHLVTLDPVRHPRQAWFARLLIALDRGRRVRTAEAYRALLPPAFGEVETALLTDLSRVPASHFVMRARLGGVSAPPADSL